MTTKKAKTVRQRKGAHKDSIGAFAYHLSEVMRLARTADYIPADFYNQFGEACNDYLTNELLRDSETPEFIKFALERITLRVAASRGAAKGEG